MNKNLMLKGILMVVIAFLAQTISTSGLPTTTVGWEILGITTLGTVAIYVAQSLMLPTSSSFIGINWMDLLKGALIALGNFLSSMAASFVVESSLDYSAMIKAALVVLGTYMAKQLFTKPAENASE